MALLLFLFLYHLHLLLLFPILAASKCPESFQCGHHFSLEFPFSQDPQCGIFNVSSCNDSGFPVLQIEKSWYHIIEKISTNKFKVLSFFLSDFLRERKCFPSSNVSLPQNPSISFTISSNLTSFFTCNNQTPDHYIQHYFQNHRSFYNKDCGPSTVYYLNTTDSPVTEESNISTNCGKFQLPIDYSKGNSSGLLELLSAEFTLEWNVSQACYECYHGGGQCVHNSRNEFRCKKGTFNIGFLFLFIFLLFSRKNSFLFGHLLWKILRLGSRKVKARSRSIIHVILVYRNVEYGFFAARADQFKGLAIRQKHRRKNTIDKFGSYYVGCGE